MTEFPSPQPNQEQSENEGPQFDLFAQKYFLEGCGLQIITDPSQPMLIAEVSLEKLGKLELRLRQEGNTQTYEVYIVGLGMPDERVMTFYLKDGEYQVSIADQPQTDNDLLKVTAMPDNDLVQVLSQFSKSLFSKQLFPDDQAQKEAMKMKRQMILQAFNQQVIETCQMRINNDQRSSKS